MTLLRTMAFSVALAFLAPLGMAAAPTVVQATSDDCITQLLLVWGPHVPGLCTASLDATMSVSCGASCTLSVATSATGTSQVPAGAGVFSWVAYGEFQPCGYLVSTFAEGLPPCASGYAYPCSAVVELAGSVSCSGALEITFATPPGACSSFVLGATGHGRLRAPPSPSPPPFTVLVYDSAYAQAPYSLVRGADGAPSLVPGSC